MGESPGTDDATMGHGDDDAKADDALVIRECAGSVADVLARLTAQLELRGIRMFAVIDHAQAARDVGLHLDDEVVAIFGNAAVGTSLMTQNARAGIDLPLRILIWDDEGTTKVAFTPPSAIARRFSLDATVLPIRPLTVLLEELTDIISR